ncbi:MAG: two-component sensor histidine kinase [Bacteroidales bacterium]|nr:two-component sensor histidine kinase [Bacteroidales bacterium]
MRTISAYTRKWIVFAVSFFLLIAVVLMVSEFFHERRFRINVLNEKLRNYVTITQRFIEQQQVLQTGRIALMDSLKQMISDETIRITLIDKEGVVLYDSEVENSETMENHFHRPEIQESLREEFGTSLRVSGTTSIKYYYYAISYTGYFVRISSRYDTGAREFIQPDRIFIMFIILIILVAAFTVILVADKFGQSVSTLREFTMKASGNKPFDDKLVFPETELGNIGQEIIEIYRNLNRTKEELLSEKTKLIRHLNLLDEGIAIFSKEKQVITSNTHFIRFINHISDTRVFTADEFFRIGDFAPIFSFVNKYLEGDHHEQLPEVLPTYEITLVKNGRFFSAKCIVFQDKSFEVSVNDVTKPTKRKLLKQQLTENIAHELKTPVSSIKGFLETILEGNTDEARTTDYLRRAYSQSVRLADLINDISLLTKMEEAANLYKIEPVNLSELVNDIAGEIQPQLAACTVDLRIVMRSDLTISGNAGLLYSVFRNLFDNTIAYAGTGISAQLEHYMSDEDFHYFSYFDTGVGVPDEDLMRIFERFYRVEKGRDRKKGGTGLGLAIVKNAIQFHRGDISVKNRPGGGLEFLFTLAHESGVSRE